VAAFAGNAPADQIEEEYATIAKRVKYFNHYKGAMTALSREIDVFNTLSDHACAQTIQTAAAKFKLEARLE
jgi:hypothetical protein